MSKTPFVPPLPHITPPDQETIESLQNSNPKDFEKSAAYQKYVKPTLDREKMFKRKVRKQWWSDNWIGITTLIAAVLTLIATIVFGLLQVLG